MSTTYGLKIKLLKDGYEKIKPLLYTYRMLNLVGKGRDFIAQSEQTLEVPQRG